MLPVVICEPDGAARAHWMELLGELVRKEYPALRLEMLPGNEHELSRVLETEDGIILTLLAVTDEAEGGVERCIQMFGQVMERNRDNYAVLCIYDGSQLNTVLSRCMRPAGILLAPFPDELTRASLRRILNDYMSLHSHEDETEYMMVNSGKTVRRIAYRDILYLEAQDKLLNICLGRHVITVRGSLNALAETLPEEFIRCHRSYIVNRSYIERLNLPEMALHLTTQERLPISRSYKEALRESLKAEGWT